MANLYDFQPDSNREPWDFFIGGRFHQFCRTVWFLGKIKDLGCSNLCLELEAEVSEPGKAL